MKNSNNHEGYFTNDCFGFKNVSQANSSYPLQFNNEGVSENFNWKNCW